MSTTSPSLVKARNEAASLRNRLSNARDKIKQESGNMLRTGVSIGTGYGLGWAEQRWGAQAFAGMDTSLGVGLIATGAAWFDLGGAEITQHLRTVGDTALGVYAYKTGHAHAEQSRS